MSDEELIAAIIRAWRSVGPDDDDSRAREALRIITNGQGGEPSLTHVGWMNPRTGAMHKPNAEVVGDDWTPVFTKGVP